jgi:hypothetical protein
MKIEAEYFRISLSETEKTSVLTPIRIPPALPTAGRECYLKGTFPVRLLRKPLDKCSFSSL